MILGGEWAAVWYWFRPDAADCSALNGCEATDPIDMRHMVCDSESAALSGSSCSESILSPSAGDVVCSISVYVESDERPDAHAARQYSERRLPARTHSGSSQLCTT
jgi:hypothetical protein